MNAAEAVQSLKDQWYGSPSLQEALPLERHIGLNLLATMALDNDGDKAYTRMLREGSTK